MSPLPKIILKSLPSKLKVAGCNSPTCLILAKTFLHFLNLVATPVLVGVSPSWYWLTRRTAAKLYPLYGTAKLIWLKITNWRFELAPKRRSAANAKPRRPSV